MITKPHINIEQIRYIQNGKFQRVEASIGNSPLWFETTDAALRPSPEAFVSAFLIPALSLKSDISLEEAIDDQWRVNLEKLMSIYKKWWGYHKINIKSPDVTKPLLKNGTKTALFFSGGVDSFFSLFRSGYKIDYLIFIHGFDIPLHDQNRFERFKESLNEVARKINVKSVVIRTNLRAHPIFANVSWERTHGGALASVAHMFADAQRFIISSSFPLCLDRPCGSHWTTDALWATGNFEILYTGGEFWRSEKLIAIADEPVVRDHLRVCWENKDSRLNCSRCEKCIRTILVLLKCHKRGKFTVFHDRNVTASDIDTIPNISDGLIPIYRDFLQGDLSRDIKSAIRRLIFRSSFKLLFKKIDLFSSFRFFWLLLPWYFRQKIKKVIRYRVNSA